MGWIIEKLFGAILNFVSGRVEQWMKQEIRYQQNKRVLIEEVKDVARKAADDHDTISIDRESIDGSLLRLERIVVKRNRDGNPG